MRRTKIVATVGPACDSPDMLDQLIRAGMDVARVNLSHGTLAIQRQRIRAIREASQRTGKEIGIMIDTRGAEVRLGEFERPVHLQVGDRFQLWAESRTGSQEGAYVNWSGLFAVVKRGQRLLFDDGNIVMECTGGSVDTLDMQVIVGGVIKSRKKISSPGSEWPLDPLPLEDREALVMGLEEQVDMVAASFVRSGRDIVEIRRIFDERQAEIFIIAKIEGPQAVQNLDEIMAASDGVMVARGDLGVEMPAQDVPWLQKEIIQNANRRGIPVITATQMLESMLFSPRPTRAEASDVANAIWDGSDAVMLSAETASGQFPIESLAMMSQVAENADNRPQYLHRVGWDSGRIADQVSRASAEIGESLKARAILTITESGYTARMVSRSRPQVSIVALSPHRNVIRRLTVVWGITGLLLSRQEEDEDVVSRALRQIEEQGLVAAGDIVVVTAGLPHGSPGTTNFIRVETISQPILTGQGFGRERIVTAPVHFVSRMHGNERIESPYVLVTYGMVDEKHLGLLKHADVIITEESGLTSDIAIAGMNLGAGMVLGVRGVRDTLREGELITVDTARGVIFRGRTPV